MPWPLTGRILKKARTCIKPTECGRTHPVTTPPVPETIPTAAMPSTGGFAAKSSPSRAAHAHCQMPMRISPFPNPEFNHQMVMRPVYRTTID